MRYGEEDAIVEMMWIGFECEVRWRLTDSLREGLLVFFRINRDFKDVNRQEMNDLFKK